MRCALKEVYLYLPLSTLDQVRVLSNGNSIPMITFGTGFIDDFDDMYKAIDAALECGYRSFDIYPSEENEANVGYALDELLPKYELTREDIYLTTKILPRDYGKDRTKRAVCMSLRNLRTWYVDFCLMQWPGPRDACSDWEINKCLRDETWKDMEDLHREGLIRNMGVSNFTPKHLLSLMENCRNKPVINQVEFHPRFRQRELTAVVKENGILLQTICYKNCFHPRVVTDESVVKVAKEVERTPTQVVLKWILNNGVAVVTQSQDPKTIKENFELFEFLLERPEMVTLNNIEMREKYLHNPICVE